MAIRPIVTIFRSIARCRVRSSTLNSSADDARQPAVQLLPIRAIRCWAFSNRIGLASTMALKPARRISGMPLAQLLFYALPAIPIAAMTLPLYIIVPTFYSETLGLSLGAVGAALLVVRTLDAVSDPAIGWLSDRWRPALGRRRGFFVMALPVAAISCVMLFWPPEKPGVLYLAFWGALLSMGFTATQLSYTAWGAELAGNYRERSRIAGFREAFTLVGTLIAIVLPFAIGLEGGGLHGLAVLGLIVAAALLVFGALTVAKVPEPREYTISRLGIGEGLRHMARNGPFVRLIAAYFLNGLSNGIPATLFL
jgi:Na+/melibiose symporter-like transporter